MLLAAYSLGDVILSLLWIFLLVLWFFLIITIFMDLWARDDLSGWAKALWVLGIIILPLIGILIYLIARPKPSAEDMAAAQAEYDDYQAGVATSQADELAKIEKLHQDGTITDDEYQEMRRKAMA